MQFSFFSFALPPLFFNGLEILETGFATITIDSPKCIYHVNKLANVAPNGNLFWHHVSCTGQDF